MAPRYLLDTNILSDIVRDPRGSVARHLARVGETTICTSIIVAAELRYGAAKANSARLAERIERVLAVLDVVPFETPGDRCYAELRHTLARAGTPIGPNDLLIAAHALALELVLVTDNLREFQRVPGLGMENWLQVGA